MQARLLRVAAWASVLFLASTAPGALWAHPLDRDGDGYPDAPQYAVPWTPQQEAKARSLADKIARARFGSSVSSALRELRGLGPAARFAVPEVVMVMERFDGRTKEDALSLLKDPTFMRQAVYPALVHHTGHPNKWVKQLAESVVNEAAQVDVPVYEHCLNDPDEAVRKQALWALSIVGEGGRSAAPAVAERIWRDREVMAQRVGRRQVGPARARDRPGRAAPLRRVLDPRHARPGRAPAQRSTSSCARPDASRRRPS